MVSPRLSQTHTCIADRQEAKRQQREKLAAAQEARTQVNTFPDVPRSFSHIASSTTARAV